VQLHFVPLHSHCSFTPQAFWFSLQEKLVPVEQTMEETIARIIGKPYAARKVTFHLPDFIDIVINAGDDRRESGATIGQQNASGWDASLDTLLKIGIVNKKMDLAGQLGSIREPVAGRFDLAVALALRGDL